MEKEYQQEEAKKVLRRLNALKNKFRKSIQQVESAFTPEYFKEHFYIREDLGIPFLRKSGAFAILQTQEKRVIHFPDPHTHKMGGDGNSICYSTFLVDDRLIGLVMEYSLLTEKSEYEILKFMAYAEGRGACQFREGGGNGPLNRSVKMAEGRGMVDCVLNGYMLPYSQDEDYVQPSPENVREPRSGSNQNQNNYIPEPENPKSNQSAPEEKEAPPEITEESKRLYEECKKIIQYKHGEESMFTDQDAREKMAELNNSVFDQTIIQRVYQNLVEEKTAFIEMISPDNKEKAV